MNRHDHHQDELFMRRAHELALMGCGYVSPNPLVGCVIVHNNRIIGEGWHAQYGQAHAEVNAINSVTDKSLLPESTVYVNLEPCAHFGKTPPCADMLIKYRVRKVVISNVDPNPQVNEGGIRKLREAGIEVITGILEKEGRELNKRFFTRMEQNRSYIILKWAQTADGFMAKENYDSKWISNAHSRQLVHKWRSEEDAVLVGTKTAFHDNPKLNVREWTGRNPTRIVIDRFLKLSPKLHVFDRSQPTLVYNVLKHEEHPDLVLARVDERDFLNELVSDLNKRSIQSVLVEGGAQTLQYFIDAGLWDEARVFTSGHTFGRGIRSPQVHGNLISSESVLSDILSTYHLVHGKS
ncbi:MAG: bifunctional diaminohydroxyphosphoribosylaminopyrimidine deaminase/5-amino-6-(5-phosphoribosylamino)uracil reductase RibD [Cyclobacteriaceae bacterium]|nr:bifunctional diaminohydroxyphosphoribosylaminopyrimidine deaminase/5-amino-6-(5-phosphoribosylamino)uracil reductase RibD [Cyclobacteriaceae bacterium]